MDKKDNKKVKALFFDIDGTLVSFKTHRIPQSTVDALEKAKKNGVEVISLRVALSRLSIILVR